ncbi:MAG: lysostaphin resistance A-like protein, partial [Acidimicrobiia bacterium]
IGYLIGAGLAAAMVVQMQRGEWSSLGLEGNAKVEFVKGAAFGLSLAGLLPIGLVVGFLGTRELIVSTFGFTSTGSIALFGLLLLLMAPVVEEVYFRGVLYGKLAESASWAAILFSTVGFVVASGAIVPVVIIFGLALAIRRRRMTVWFTIGAHAVWLLTILLMTLYLVAGPARSFMAGDGLYSFDHIPGWKQVKKNDPSDHQAKVDAVFESPTGEKITVERFSLAGRQPEDVPHLLEYMQQDEAGSTPQPSSSVEGGKTYESSSKSGETEQTRVAVAPDGQDEVVVFTLECPDGNCKKAEDEFKEILETVEFPK